jgi:hypothetical protein
MTSADETSTRSASPPLGGGDGDGGVDGTASAADVT